MSHQVIWTKFVLQTFIAQANLNEDEQLVMRTRAAGWTRMEQIVRFEQMGKPMSISKLDKIIKRLKAKYDAAERYNPLLPPRKDSAAETYMDEH